MLERKFQFLPKELTKNLPLENFISSLHKTLPISIGKKKKKVDKINFYWLKDLKNTRNMTKRFQRAEFFALRGNFIM